VHDDRDLAHARACRLLEQHAQRGLGDAVAVDERLERELALVGAGGGDDGFADLQGGLAGGSYCPLEQCCLL